MIARVDHKQDPDNPCRSTHYIFGDTPMIVQDAINTMMATVDTAFGGTTGQAHAIGPIRDSSGWAAVVVILLEPERVDA